MEEKKKIKVSLSAIVIFILIAIIIGMGCYIYKLNKDKYYMTVGASEEIKELNNKIEDLENKNVDNSKSENEEETNLDNENNNIKFDNDYFLENGQIIKIDEDTNQISLKELGLSFQYPNNFKIKYTNNNLIMIEIPHEPLVSMSIDMNKEDYSKWLSFFKNDPWAVRIIEDSDIKVSNYDAHYFRCNVGNATDDYEDKYIFIKTNNNNGYKTNFSVDIGFNDPEIVDPEKIEKRQQKTYNEYEPIFDKIVSTLKFEK